MIPSAFENGGNDNEEEEEFSEEEEGEEGEMKLHMMVDLEPGECILVLWEWIRYFLME